MRNILIVARHEYWVNLRRPAFLFAVFGVPLLIGVVMFLMGALIANAETDVESLGEIGYVDEAGVIVTADVPFVAYDEEAAARQALDDGTVGAYFVIPTDYLMSGEITIYSGRNVPAALRAQINNLLVTNLTAQVSEGVSVERLTEPVNLTVRALDRNRDFQEESAFGLVMLPIIYTIVFFIAAQTTSTYLMSSVVEEKTSRVIEILITTVTPLQLLFGKILGLGALGLTQLVIWLAAGIAFLRFGPQTPFLSGLTLPPDLIVISLLYFLLAYSLFAGMLAGVGAISSSEQESRQLAGVLSLLSAIPFFFFTPLIFDPGSGLAVTLTLIPFTAPLAAIIRLSVGTMPVGQLVASLLILLVTVIFVIWMSARVFRWSLLLYGKRPGPRELWRVMRGRSETAVGTTPQE